MARAQTWVVGVPFLLAIALGTGPTGPFFATLGVVALTGSSRAATNPWRPFRSPY